MNEIINVRVNGNTLTKDYGTAGVQGEANSTKLRITFDDNWDGFAKTITFWNALGINPVNIVLGTNLLEDILVSTRVYIVPIPGEAMTEAGENTFVVRGYIDGVIKRTVEGKLKVAAAMQADDADAPADVTPTQAEQLQAEINSIAQDIADVKALGEDVQSKYKDVDAAVASAEANANLADESAYKSVMSAVNADASETWAAEHEVAARQAKEAIENMTVSSESIGAGKGATVEKTVGEVVNLHFGIPKGEPGIKIGEGAPPDEVLEDEDVKAWIDLNGEGDDYVTQDELADALNGYVEKTDIDVLQADVEGLQKQINEEAHFRGYLSTNAKIQALEATQNDFAYSAESGTKWVYDDGWKDTGSPVPDQLTPASNATPLINGVATPGQSEEYARGDHRHPTDTTRVSVAEFNLLKNDISIALDAILAMQTSYIGGDTE